MSLASHVHLDPIGGISGDMFVAALLHAFPQLEAPLLELLRSLPMPVPVEVTTAMELDHSLQGKIFTVTASVRPGENRSRSVTTTRMPLRGRSEYLPSVAPCGVKSLRSNRTPGSPRA